MLITSTNFDQFKTVLKQLEIPSKENKIFPALTVELVNDFIEKNYPFLQQVQSDFDGTIILNNIIDRVKKELSFCYDAQELIEKISIHICKLSTLPRDVLEPIFSPLAISIEYSSTIARISKSWNRFCYSEKKVKLLNLIHVHSLKIKKLNLRPELELCCIKEMTSQTAFFLDTLRKNNAKRWEIEVINKEVKAKIFKEYSNLEAKIALTKLEKIFVIHADDINVSTTKARVLLSKEPDSELRFIPKNANTISKNLQSCSDRSAIRLSELLVKKPDDHRPIEL